MCSFHVLIHFSLSESSGFNVIMQLYIIYDCFHILCNQVSQIVYHERGSSVICICLVDLARSKFDQSWPFKIQALRDPEIIV